MQYIIDYAQTYRQICRTALPIALSKAILLCYNLQLTFVIRLIIRWLIPFGFQIYIINLNEAIFFV